MMGAGFLENQRIAKIETWVFYFTAGFALSTSLSIAAANIFLSLGLIALIIRLWFKHDDLGRILKIDRGITIAFAALMGATLLSGLCSVDPVLSLQFFCDYYGYRMLGLFLVLICVPNKKRLLWLTGLIVVSILLNNLYTVWMGIMLPTKDRPAGFMSYMAQAGMLSAAIPIFLLAGLKVKDVRWKGAALAAVVLSVAALLFNGTRGGWLAVAATAPLTAWLFMENKLKWLAGCLIMALLLGGCFAMSPKLEHQADTLHQMDYQSNHERLLMWTSAYHMFQDHPLLGVGFAQYADAYQNHYIMPEAKERQQGHAHSNVMQMLGERGGLGCLAFLGMWLYFIVFSIRGWLRQRNVAYLAFFSIVMGVMLQGLTEYNMGTTVVSKFYWFALGICLQWIALSKEDIKL